MDSGQEGDFFDTYDEQGHPTGAAVHRDEIHARGLWHGTVHVWIHDERGRVLLQKRADTKDSHPGLWDVSTAGHREPGEGPLPAALREVEEELGIGLPAEKLFLIATVKDTIVSRKGAFIDREIAWIYLVRADGEMSGINPNPEEVSAVRFFTTDEIRELSANGDGAFKLVPHSVEYYRTVLDEIDLLTGHSTAAGKKGPFPHPA